MKIDSLEAFGTPEEVSSCLQPPSSIGGSDTGRYGVVRGCAGWFEGMTGGICWGEHHTDGKSLHAQKVRGDGRRVCGDGRRVCGDSMRVCGDGRRVCGDGRRVWMWRTAHRPQEPDLCDFRWR